VTVTVWGPVFVAAATVDPDALTIAVPIVAVHRVGLPLGLLIVIRVLPRAFDAVRAARRRHRPAGSARAGYCARVCDPHRFQPVLPT
jgi:hypothetical protein